MRKLLVLAMVLVALGGVLPLAAAETEVARLSLLVFKAANPAADIEVIVDTAVSGRTDAGGAIYLQLPPGRHDLSLREGEVSLLDLELMTEAGEQVQILVTIPPVGAAEVDIESSRTGVGAGGVAPAEEKPQGPPGLVKGQVVDVETGKGVVGARIFISGVSLEAETDADGAYVLEVPAGDYALSVIHADYSTQTLSSLHVAANETTEANIEVSPAGIELADFVVTAPFIEGSIASVVSQQRETSEVTEVIGAEQMSRAGDSDAAGALKRVTGLTLSDGKYINIRGQPARYTQTTWNGSLLPSPDPIKRIVPLDLFPTGVLSSVEVQKSFSPGMPGSFGGGLIGLKTRAAPEDGLLEVSAGTGINSQSTFKDGYRYEAGKRQFLGKADDDVLGLPSSVESVLAENRDTGLRLPRELGKDFPNIYAPERHTLPPDKGLSLTGGKTFKTPIGDLGLLATGSWSEKYRFVEEIDRNFQGDSLSLVEDFKEERTDRDISLGGLLVASAAWEGHQIHSNTFFVRNTTKRVEISSGLDATSDEVFERGISLDWNQREMLIQQFTGAHDFSFLKLDWRVLQGWGDRDAPDRREYRYVQLPSGEFILDLDGVTRRYNTVEDEVGDYGADLTLPVLDGERLGFNLGGGFAFSNQDRSSETSVFEFAPDDSLAFNENGDPRAVEDILDPVRIDEGTLDFKDLTQGSDTYDGEVDVRAYYFKTDFSWHKIARLVAGLRQETADFSVTTYQKQFLSPPKPIPTGFKTDDLLPSVSLTGFIGDDMQVRLAYGQSVSRPLLIELADTTYFDPDTNERYQGNPALQPVEFDSYDLRWEWYPSATESMTVGLFRKDLTNAIERTFTLRAGGGEQTNLVNAESATVQGIEFGTRLGLGMLSGDGFLSSWMKDGYFQGNVSILTSSVDNPGEGDRSLQGQASHILNAQLGNDGERFDWSLLYNRVGKRLDRLGVNPEPNVFLQPVDRVDFVWGWRFAERWSLKFKARNLLDPTYEFTQGDKIQRSRTKGRDFSLSFKWAL